MTQAAGVDTAGLTGSHRVTLCLEFAAESLRVHDAVALGGHRAERKEASVGLGGSGRLKASVSEAGLGDGEAPEVPALALCLLDLAPFVIPAVAGEKYPAPGDDADGCSSSVHFGGRGRAALFDLGWPEVRSHAAHAPFWIFAISSAEGTAQARVLASACLDLGACLARAAAAGPRSEPPAYTRSSVHLVASTDHGCGSNISAGKHAATLLCALRVSCVHEERLTDAAVVGEPTEARKLAELKQQLQQELDELQRQSHAKDHQASAQSQRPGVASPPQPPVISSLVADPAVATPATKASLVSGPAVAAPPATKASPVPASATAAPPTKAAAPVPGQASAAAVTKAPPVSGSAGAPVLSAASAKVSPAPAYAAVPKPSPIAPKALNFTRVMGKSDTMEDSGFESYSGFEEATPRTPAVLSPAAGCPGVASAAPTAPAAPAPAPALAQGKPPEPSSLVLVAGLTRELLEMHGPSQQSSVPSQGAMASPAVVEGNIARPT